VLIGLKLGLKKENSAFKILNMIQYLQSKPDDFYFYPKKKKKASQRKIKSWIQALIYWTESSLESELGLEAGGFCLSLRTFICLWNLNKYFKESSVTFEVSDPIRRWDTAALLKDGAAFYVW